MTGPHGASGVVGQLRPGFKLDLGRCVGCGACVLGCRIENQLPTGVSWRRVLQVNRPRIGGGPTYHLSVACHHCENPPCVRGCPSGALEKRPDGLVLLESDRCIGCRYCEMACPFMALSYDTRAGVMTKCHLCHHRLAQGLAPACVEACPTGALGHFQPDSWDGAGQAGEARDEADTRMEADARMEADTTGKAFGLAIDIPGFGDPAGADPGFWVADPGGAIRSEWFLELKALLGLQMEEPDDPA